MADVTYPGETGIVGLSDVGGNQQGDSFVPQIWSDEIRATYENSLVLANLVKKMSMVGKRGDRIHVPAPVRGSAYAKAENTAVTIQMNDEGEIPIDIDRHYEYSRLIEDIVEVQALSSLRRFYTEDAGYALAKQMDTDLFSCGTGFGDGTLDLAPDETGADWVNSAVFYPSSTTAASAYAVNTVEDTDLANFVDFHMRFLVQKLDDADVPMDNRCFVVPPSLRNQLMSIDRYMSSDFTLGSGKVSKGKIGEIYGVEVYVSTNCPVIENATENTATVSTQDVRGAFMIHRDTLVCAEQKTVRSQTQYKQEYLSTLYTADTIYGVKPFRPDAGFIMAVPN